MSLDGKVAIVTGAGKGIGKGIALELAKAGADVAIVYAHSKSGANSIVNEVLNLGHKAIAIKADISNLGEIDTMVETVWKEFEQIDILVNNSGITERKPFLEITEEFWNRTIDINLKGTFFCIQAVVRKMKRTGGGKIVNIGSVNSRASMEQLSPYAASKGGLNSLTMQLALELAPLNIHINVVAPGLIEVEKLHDDPLYERDHRAKQIPLGRVGFPDDIGKVVVFYASQDSDFITGQVVYVDGGMLCKIPMVRSGKAPII